MLAVVVTELTHWSNFFVIIGAAAGTLIGLQFVVITLSAYIGRSGPPSGAIRAYATPTIVHFSAVLLTAGVLSMPKHSRASLTTTLVLIAIGGLGYVAWITVEARRQDAYSPVRSDWVWHTILPLASYGAVFIAGLMAASATAASLYVVGAAVLLLLFIGIHNAWDGAIYMLQNASRSEDDRE
jgi:hypothetical protein